MQKHSAQWYITMKRRMSGRNNPMFKDAKKEGKCIFCGKQFQYYKSNKSGLFCSHVCHSKYHYPSMVGLIKKGDKHTQESKNKMSIKSKGRKHTPEHIRKRFASFKNTIYKRHIANKKYDKLRNNKAYLKWKGAVLERDNYKCTECGSDDNLCVHHEIPFSFLLYEFSRGISKLQHIYNVDNGVTLCKECHKKTINYLKQTKKTPEYILLSRLEKYYKEKYGKTDGFNTWYADQLDKIGQQFLEKIN